MKTFFATAALVSASVFAGSADAASVYIDLGKKSTTTGTTDTYNNVSTDGFFFDTVAPVPLKLNGGAATTAPLALLDTTGAASGISFDVDSLSDAGGYVGDNGSNFSGPFPASLSGIETTALESMWTFARGIDANFTFTGLDNSKAYNITFYGAHDQAGSSANSSITFDLLVGTGSAPASEVYDTFNNTSDVLAYTGVSPNNGTIQFLLDNNNVGSAEGWLNFISIEVVPEPSSLALLALGGVFTLRRRR